MNSGATVILKFRKHVIQLPIVYLVYSMSEGGTAIATSHIYS